MCGCDEGRIIVRPENEIGDARARAEANRVPAVDLERDIDLLILIFRCDHVRTHL